MEKQIKELGECMNSMIRGYDLEEITKEDKCSNIINNTLTTSVIVGIKSLVCVSVPVAILLGIKLPVGATLDLGIGYFVVPIFKNCKLIFI